MKVYRNIDEFTCEAASVVTIGTFDGVHVGHKKLFNQLKEATIRLGGESVVLTFFPHPRMVLFPDDTSLKLLHSIEERIQHFYDVGVDHLVVYPFSLDFSQMTPISYVRDLLVAKLNVQHLVIGYDHRFGKNREGDIKDLLEFSEVYDFTVEEVGVQLIEDIKVSSTKVRKALLEGDIMKAEKLLGYPYSISGKVVKGNQIGRELSFPTANIQMDFVNKLVPANGVYAVKIRLDKRSHFGMMNIGVRPTFENLEPSIEVHIFDFSSEVYGCSIQVEILKKVRDERKFESIDALVNQLKKDKKHVRDYLS